MFRLETRAGEFTAVASLKVEAWRRRETNMHTASLWVGEVRSLKGLGVTAVRLETGRSSLGQGEARRKPGGGPNGY